MFKKIVALIIAAESVADLDAICFEIDKAFNANKITWKEDELLYDLICKVSGGARWKSGIKFIKE